MAPVWVEEYSITLVTWWKTQLLGQLPRLAVMQTPPLTGTPWAGGVAQLQRGPAEGPTGHINVRILNPGSETKTRGDSRKHNL